MDLCRNVIVSGGLTSECQPDQLFSSSCSQICSLDDFFSSHNMVEGGTDDVGLEWLSIFIEDCLTSSGNCLPVPVVPTNITNEVDEKKKTTSSLSAAVSSKSQRTSSTRFDGLPNMFVIAAGKGARSKRKRIPVAKSKSKVTSSSRSWSGRHIPLEMTGCCSSVDPPLLQQTYWLADSELIFPRKDDDGDDDDQQGGRNRSRERSAERDGKEVVVLIEEMVGGEVEKVMGKEDNSKGRVSNGQQQGRRCSHCLAQRTPQWRAGPLGPKTLCNACGVRYKSGRLLPEYRPAKSPTFVSYLHSNSHKKVLEMRQSILSSHSSS